MVRRLGACALSALLCCFVLAAPVRATEPADDFVTVPFATYGDMLVDAAHRQVFVTGGHGYNQIAVVHLDGSGVTMIPNAPGAAELTMSDDGSTVYASLYEGDGIAEIDTETLELRRISTGAGSCPTEIAAVAGYVWFVAASQTFGCSQFRSIRRLDPVTGAVSPDVVYPDVYSPVMREVPGSTKLLVIERNSIPNAEVLDVTDGSFTSVVEGNVKGSVGPSTQLTTDGSHLMLSGYGFVYFYRLSDLAADGVNRLSWQHWPDAFAANQDVALFEEGFGEIHVLSRGSDTELNSVILGPEATARQIRGMRLAGDELFVVALAGQTLRLYQVDNPAAPSPQLTLEVPSETPAGEPLTVSGVLSYQGSPIAGATVTVREEGVEQPLGTPTTDAAGRYSLEAVPHDPERMYLTAKYAGEASTKPAVAREVVGVVRRPVTLTLAMPDSLWRDEVVPISGTLSGQDGPLPGVSLVVDRICEGLGGSQTIDTVVTDSNGSFATQDLPGDACDFYDYFVRYSGDNLYAPTYTTARLTIKSPYPGIDLQIPSAMHVGDSISVSGTLATLDGPLAGKEMALEVQDALGRHDLGRVVTAPDGSFHFADQLTVAGSHCYTATFAGDARYEFTQIQRCVNVAKWDTRMELSGPTSAALDDPVVLTGRLTTAEGDALAGVELALSRTDRFRGTETLPTVVTAADGSFLVRDVPPNGQLVTYAASYAGTTSQAATSASWDVNVSLPSRTVTITTDRLDYGYGQTANIGVDVTGSDTAWVNVFAKEANRDWRTIYSGEAPPSGLALQYKMRRNTKFQAQVPQDGRGLGALTIVDRTTRATLTTKARGAYATTGIYKLYRPTADPKFITTISPARNAGCMGFQLQRRSSTGWQTTSNRSCAAIGDASTASWTLTGRQPVRTPYRVRSLFAGDDTNTATNGPWVYFKFR